MKMNDIKHGVGSLWDTVTEGWSRLRESASSALTRYKPGTSSNLPASGDVDDGSYLPSQAWAMIGGDLFEDDKRLVVRLELPGMDKTDFDIEVSNDQLLVRGEKRFERESTEGRWRLLQCAYGAFHRAVALPVPVKGDEARATYVNGVLRVELPKAEPGQPRTISVKVG
jgi:HSP20 family protein